MSFDEAEVKQLNAFAGFLSFKFSWVFKKFINCPDKILLLIYGNQGGKTGGTAFSYVLRILGQHPIAKKNVVYYDCEEGHEIAPFEVKKKDVCPKCGGKTVLHDRGSRVFRFGSQNLPGQSANVSSDGISAEVKNTQYPEFKKWLPPFLIKKDITFRSPTMIIKDPFEGKDIIIEFVSYNQSVQSTAGTQRMSIWCDESPDFDFYEEQIPRLIAEDGDLVFTYTPVDRSSWLFDEFFEKSRVYYRSKTICDFLNSTDTIKVEPTEFTGGKHSIAVFMASTDDNPTLKKDIIDAMFDHIGDPDIISIRRYGIFKQLSGRIFKDFDYKIHYLNKEKYFPDGVPYNWVHGRGIDFHPQTPWAVLNMSLSPENELFVWGELNPSPEKFTIKEISKMVALIGEDYKFRCNLIDPLSEATKKDNMTVKADINTAFRELRREGIGVGAFWESWDTKGEKGRDAVRERIKNAKVVKTPFNNRVTRNGKEYYLPTLWVLNTCPIAAKYMKNWRWEEWADSKSRILKEDKNKPEQRWSHFNMVIEALLKEESFRPKSLGSSRRETPSYYNRDTI